MSGARLLDERHDPPLRQRIGALLTTAVSADLALARVRLANLDLTEDEVRGPRRCRVLLGQLDAATLLDTTLAGPASRPATLLRLANWLESDRLAVRSAGIAAWTPDFSIYSDGRGGTRCLVGAHYFGSPRLAMGPSFTMLIEDPAAATLLARRFAALWARGHDVAPAILDVLRSVPTGGPGADRA